MKRQILYMTFCSLLIITASCRKKTLDNTPIMSITDQKAFVQVYNGTLNSSRNFVYVNGAPANGATIAFGAAFPASSYGFVVWKGDNNLIIKDTLSTSTQVMQSFILPAKANANYSIFTYDTITSPKRLIVENTFENITDNSARIRFVNLIYNPTAIPSVDLYSVNTGNIITYIGVGQATNFIPIAPNVPDTWQVRQAGTSTVLASLTVSSSTINAKRHYSIIYRGSHRASANRGISVIANN